MSVAHKVIPGQVRTRGPMAMEVNFSFSQGVEEVVVEVRIPGTFPPPPLDTKRDIKCIITTTTLLLSLRGEVVLEGELQDKVVKDECSWMRSGDVITITMIKSNTHATWPRLMKSGDGVVALTTAQVEETQKSILLEKFQQEHRGFDFSSAEVTGSLPSDPKNFMRE